MIKLFWTLGLALVTAMALGACGGGDSASDTAADNGAEMAQDQGNATESGSATEEAVAEDAETPPAAADLYVTVHDPDAVYSYADLPMRGSYLKVDFEELNEDQINRVVHRLRSEFCTCGCPSDPIDQCLVNDPNCTTAVTLAKQIIREEKIKG